MQPSQCKSFPASPLKRARADQIDGDCRILQLLLYYESREKQERAPARKRAPCRTADVMPQSRRDRDRRACGRCRRRRQGRCSGDQCRADCRKVKGREDVPIVPSSWQRSRNSPNASARRRAQRRKRYRGDPTNRVGADLKTLEVGRLSRPFRHSRPSRII